MMGVRNRAQLYAPLELKCPRCGEWMDYCRNGDPDAHPSAHNRYFCRGCTLALYNHGDLLEQLKIMNRNKQVVRRRKKS